MRTSAGTAAMKPTSFLLVSTLTPQYHWGSHCGDCRALFHITNGTLFVILYVQIGDQPTQIKRACRCYIAMFLLICSEGGYP